MTYKTIDLCAGIGGIRRGFELAGGFTNVASAEIDEAACKTYEHNFGDISRNDITTEEFKSYLQGIEYDVLMAGFPCQAFSSAGLKQGFEDKTKGTLFFDIAKIIKMTIPKVVFLENVQNLLSHDKGNTFKTIMETLERELDYYVVGLNYDSDGRIKDAYEGFVRNSRYFGVPQNRPRIYIVAFSRKHYRNQLQLIESCDLPLERKRESIFDSLEDILDSKVDARFFLSEGYLDTLERHIERQHKKGYGFGYCIINNSDKDVHIANSLLATGGSGKERNLIFDPINGSRCAGKEIKGKFSPINKKNIRTMTPNEWGRLQGFVGYGFINEYGEDEFSFPEEISNTQRFKQIGNAVTIPVIEEIAIFIKEQMKKMEGDFSETENKLYSLYGNNFELGSAIVSQKMFSLKKGTINQLLDIISVFGNKTFSLKALADYLDLTICRANQIAHQLETLGLLRKEKKGCYRFNNVQSK